MTDAFQSSRYHIEHARTRIDDLNREIIPFLTSAFARAVEQTPDGKWDLHKVKQVRDLPFKLPGIAVNAINELWAALDQAGFAVAKAVGTKGKKAHFPSGWDEDDLKSRRRGLSKDLPTEIFDLMASFKAYPGGNHLLWGLGRLNNMNKHEILLSVPFMPGAYSASFGVEMLPGFREWLETAPPNADVPLEFTPAQPGPLRWDPVKREIIVAVAPHGTPGAHTFVMKPAVVIELPGVGPAPAPDLLYAMSIEVERVIDAVEKEARALKLF